MHQIYLFVLINLCRKSPLSNDSDLPVTLCISSWPSWGVYICGDGGTWNADIEKISLKNVSLPIFWRRKCFCTAGRRNISRSAVKTLAAFFFRLHRRFFYLTLMYVPQVKSTTDFFPFEIKFPPKSKAKPAFSFVYRPVIRKGPSVHILRSIFG